ncbi:MAG TPA: class II aldolase/adducin family protein [candidate division Zixibacteria bacterium]|nr:class II aldolase/adducin family protein [candidate division Zixibacteria bacterium]
MKLSKKDLEELKRKVALGNRIMFHQGLADYHGHVSARIPGTRRFLIKPVLAPLGEISARDIILVDIDEYMEVCEQNWAKAANRRAVTRLKAPPRETMIHAAIYDARPDVNSVVHTHQTLATAFSVAGVPLRPIYNQAAVFAPETPIFPSPRLIYTVQDGKEICQTLGDRMAMLLQGHGVVVVGDSLEYATVHAIYLERTAYMQWVASCVGKPVTMPQKDIDYMKENMMYRAYDAFAYFRSLLPKGVRV